MRVKDVMRKEVRTIKPTETVSTAKELFRRYDIHHLVVVNKRSVVGMIADRDVNDAGADLAVERAMAHPVVTITSDETVRKAAALMTGHVIGSLPVVDNGKLVGIVTTYDLVALLAKGAMHAPPVGEHPVLAKRGPRHKTISVEVARPAPTVRASNGRRNR